MSQDPETMASGESCDVLGCGPGHRCGWPKHQVEDALQAFRAANGWNIPDEGSGVANDFFRGGFHSQDAVIVRLRDELADLQSAALHYADLRPIEALEEALVLAAIPLAAIKASVKWELSTDINAAVGTALIAIRRVLAPPAARIPATCLRRPQGDQVTPTDALRAECEKALREAVRTTKCDLHGRKLCRYEDCVVTTVARAASAQLAQREAEVKALREALAGMMRGDGHVMGCLNSLHHRGQSPIADICDAARAALANRPEGE